MRLSVLLFAMVCIGAVVIGTAAPVLQDEDDVRGAFLTSRPKQKTPAAPDSTKRPSRRRPNSTVTSNPGKAPEKSTVRPTVPATGSPTVSNKPSEPLKPVNAPRIGLGMTLFTRDSNGLAVRVDPEHVFRKGDRVRVLLETNTDGFLYIFNQTNDGPVIMIYPDAQLDDAGNYIKAHVPWEIPSSAADEERLRWLMFDDVAGTERLFFVLTREPLKDIPTEDELIAFCKNSSGGCPWRPTADVWELVQKQMQAPLKKDTNGRYGRAQTGPEQQASTRGLSLAKEDPEPSLIMMASSTSPMLVTTLDLIHK
ncbi:MAG TPA: DUF4384 domain-containing protein [Pyrinomonadaceae bacterium]|jgi:hypothetical protein|nr:DUF4384 domain-containing protein [Pyrinomonadaceae bacterium]